MVHHVVGGDRPMVVFLYIALIGYEYTSAVTTRAIVWKCHPALYKDPICQDNPDGYGCICGPGYFWNMYKCVALGVNSVLDFNETEGVEYTLLLGKSMPSLRSFTIAFWLKPYRIQPSYRGTVVSYRYGTRYDILRIMSSPVLTLKINEESFRIQKLRRNIWTHIAWTWDFDEGKWQLYINGTKKWGMAKNPPQVLPSGGELVLGQSSRHHQESEEFPKNYNYLGQLAFFNIWNHPMNDTEVHDLMTDCVFMQCGDAVQWADFRSGTRGKMNMKWPATVFNVPCFDNRDAGITCDRYCSNKLGAQCNAETLENVQWGRTLADHNTTMPCPGRERDNSKNQTETPEAFRQCHMTSDNRGIWGTPDVSECISHTFQQFREEVSEYTSNGNQSILADTLRRLANYTGSTDLWNPVDIATVIDTVSLVVNSQSNASGPEVSHRMQFFSQSYTMEGAAAIQIEEADPAWLARAVSSILNHLIHTRNDEGWQAMQPQGSEGDELMRVIEHLSDVTSSLLLKSRDDTLQYGDRNQISIMNGEIGIGTRLLRHDQRKLLQFPDTKQFVHHGIIATKGSVSIATDEITRLNLSSTSDYYGISTFLVAVPEILPNLNAKANRKSNKVNSALFGLRIHLDQDVLNNLTHSIRIFLPYQDTFNISEPKCVRLSHRSGSRPWHWSRDGCHLVRSKVRYAVCECNRPGVYAVTTHMYNDQWRPPEIPIILMEIPSYVGCSVSALLCLLTALLLLSHRTSSKTASIHKNFALSIVGAQLTFMIGITQYKYPVVCKTFAITFHYFFLAMFSWLMNEAFNLYIVITYAAHAHGDQSEGGSQWRFYILGWILPGILVGAFVGTHTDEYYAEHMCWVAWKYTWLFLGPAIAIVSITMLVLIFTAKEHHESAYTKDEKSNKKIVVHFRAMWTQVILLSACWAFAFLTLKMTDSVLKYLFALFNSLQGAFFLVFYFLLNDEVQKVYKKKRKKKTLNKHSYHSSDPENSQSENMINQVSGSDGDEVELQVSSPKKRKKRKRKSRSEYKKSKIEASSDEDSDCGMIVTSV